MKTIKNKEGLKKRDIKRIKKYVSTKKDLEFKYNHTTFEIYYKGTGKEKAVKDLIGNKDITFGIGDSQADIEWLKLVDFPTCPSNAVDSVKDICKYVSPYEDVEGTIDCIKEFQKEYK